MDASLPTGKGRREPGNLSSHLGNRLPGFGWLRRTVSHSPRDNRQARILDDSYLDRTLGSFDFFRRFFNLGN